MRRVKVSVYGKGRAVSIARIFTFPNQEEVTVSILTARMLEGETVEQLVGRHAVEVPVPGFVFGQHTYRALISRDEAQALIMNWCIFCKEHDWEFVPVDGVCC